jgi:hypothetical protein
MIAVTANTDREAEHSLFPAPEPVVYRLSRLYATDEYRAQGTVRWSAYKAKADCDECFAVQHEERGTGWPRNPARWRRHLEHGYGT